MRGRNCDFFAEQRQSGASNMHVGHALFVLLALSENSRVGLTIQVNVHVCALCSNCEDSRSMGNLLSMVYLLLGSSCRFLAAFLRPSPTNRSWPYAMFHRVAHGDSYIALCLPKCNLLWQPEAGAEHPLLWRNVSYVVDLYVGCLGGDLVLQLP
jgi:hypothetical protein